MDPQIAPEPEVVIREFLPGDGPAFRHLNEEWIREHFVLEKKDQEALSNPEGNILAKAGRIFLAVRGDEPVGCCALLSMGADEFEVAKMAVTKSCQGAGIGRKLLERIIAAARESGARRLYLESNRKLAPALRLYESVGFREIPADRVTPSPYARSNIAMEMAL